MTSAPRPPRQSLLLRALILAAFALTVAVALALYRSPSPLDASAPKEAFSAARALLHLRAIAAVPRPTGSEAHQKAREYILGVLRSHGLEPEVQNAPASLAERSRPVPGGVVNNIIAILPGQSPGGPAILLSSHYDSVPAGPGASDDGAAVAAMLETLRALRAGPPPKNDIIFLFTDAEELGLIGAQVFVAVPHPLLSRIAVDLNFEARGSRGPVFMFQTSPENGWLIDELAASAPAITASSFSGDLYRKMPNDTDFTVFLRKGVPGLNFAYIGGLRHYHTDGDTIENLDLGSLQQQGDSMLALARRLGSADLLSPPKTPDAVYFNLIGFQFIHYSSRWAVPLLALASAVFASALILGIRRSKLRVFNIAASYGLLLVILLVTAIVLGIATFAMMKLDPRFSLPPIRRPHDDGVYMVVFTSIAVLISVAAYRIASRWLAPSELALGALGVWLSLAIPSSLTMPGASYLFTLPLLLGSVSLIPLLLCPTPSSPPLKATAAVVIPLLPAITILAPTIYAIYLAMTVLLSAGVLLFVTLLLGLLAAPLAIAVAPSR